MKKFPNKDFVPNTITIVYGRPGTGKTLQLLEHAVNYTKKKKKVLFNVLAGDPIFLGKRFLNTGGKKEYFSVSKEINKQSLIKKIKEGKYDVLIMDSIEYSCLSPGHRWIEEMVSLQDELKIPIYAAANRNG